MNYANHFSKMDKHECQVQQKVLSTLCEFCDVNELQDILERFSEFYKDKVREKDSNDGKILRKLLCRNMKIFWQVFVLGSERCEGVKIL